MAGEPPWPVRLTEAAEAETDCDLAFGHAVGVEPKHVADLAHR